jgi:hypothetical protein
VWQRTRNKIDKALNPEQQPSFITHYDSKTRFSMIGTVGAGKTTINALMLVTAHTKSNDDPGFYCRVREFKSGLRESAANIRQGKFPPKTIPTGVSNYESGLQLTRDRGWPLGEKHLHLPIVDVAGEDIQIMLSEYDQSPRLNTLNYNAAKTLIQYIKSSEGFIIALPAPRAHLGDTQLEPEPEDTVNDPDVNISRLLEQILNYKERTRGSKIRGIAVVITKYDLMMARAVDLGMDLYTEGGIENFMEVCFPDTNMQLKFLRNKSLVRFFPSYIDTKKDEHGHTLKWPNGSPIIEVNKATRRPSYSESSYMALFNYLEQFAS